MYERLLDKQVVPEEATICENLGEEGCRRIADLECQLRERYQLTRELKFPFGNSYGWGYKYSHKSSHLCYAFFEKNAFTVTFQIGDKQVSLLENQLTALLPKTQDLWKNRYPCGERGGWIHYRVLADEEIADVLQLLAIRKKPSAENIEVGENIMSNAVEFVAFKLKKSVSKDEFFPVSDKFNREFLAKQKGYISRKLLSKGDMWADLVLWETEADHLSAMEASKEDIVAAEYFSMLNLSAKGSFYHLFSVEKNYEDSI